MNTVCLDLYRRGHLPAVGEWYALPLMEAAGSKAKDDAPFQEIFHPVAMRLLESCDAVLRVGGPSKGGDEIVEAARARGKPVFSDIAEIPSAALNLLETERLVLRRLSVDDASFVLGLLNEPSFLRFIGDRGVRAIDDARRYIQDGPLASYARFGFGLSLVELKPSREPIGICGLLKRDSLPDVDVGFALLPGFWSKGYAFESAAAVLAQGRDAFGLKRIAAITSTDNVASIQLLEKLGFRFDRMARLSPEAPEIRLYARDMRNA